MPDSFAASVATQTAWDVLNEADDETAQLMIKLQLEDLESASTAEDTDSDVALGAYKAELQDYRAVRQSDNEETAKSAKTLTINPEQQIKLFKCVSCQDEHDADHSYRVPCQHYYCDDCLQTLFSNATNDETLYPPRCCRKVIPFEDVRTFLPEKVGNEFGKKVEELDDRHRVYCREPACGAYIGYAHRDGDM